MDGQGIAGLRTHRPPPGARRRHSPRPLWTGAALLVVVLWLASPAAARPVGPPRQRGPLPLGTLQLVPGVDRTCPEGFRCMGFEVTCPSVLADAGGFFAVADPTAPPRGTVMFFQGGYGTTWWSAHSTLTPPFDAELQAAGFQLVQVRWTDSWLFASQGESAGPALLACRPATSVQWVHDNLYVPLGVTPVPGGCGFCLTGSSGGASQISYAPTYYGLDDIIDAMFPTGGPPHAALAKGCLEVRGYAYNGWDAKTIDYSYGYSGSLQGTGPCRHHDPSFTDRWDADSVDLGGSDYAYPNTRVRFIIGQLDDTGAPFHARDFYEVLVKGGQTLEIAWQVIPGMEHEIVQSREGLAALRMAIVGSS